MTFSEAIRRCFSQYATFRGRARCKEFWSFWLLNLLIGAAYGCIAFHMRGMGPITRIPTVFFLLYMLASLVPMISASVRRLHDTGRSGASLLFLLIPVIGALLVLGWLCTAGEPGENQYGPNPINQS